MPEKYAYSVITAQRARGAGAQFGLVGALVGEAVAASSEGAGRKRFEKVVLSSPLNVRSLVHANFVRTLEGSKLFALTPSNADAAFRLDVISYGVSPVNGSELGGEIVAEAVLTDRAGKEIWNRRERAVSNTTGPLEAYEATPRLWPQVIEEAAQKLSRQLVLYTDQEQR
jgi:hypothetical protein